MLIQISFMHYMTWTRVTLPIVFELFIFFGSFSSFHYRKHLCQSLLFNKLESLRPVTLLKKRLQKLQKTQKLCLRLWTQIQATGLTACRGELSITVLQLMKKNVCQKVNGVKNFCARNLDVEIPTSPLKKTVF